MLTHTPNGSAYYREKSTGFFIRVDYKDSVPSERITNDCKIYKARAYDEHRGVIEGNLLVSDKYLKEKAVFWKAAFVPDYIRKQLSMGW